MMKRLKEEFYEKRSSFDVPNKEKIPEYKGINDLNIIRISLLRIENHEYEEEKIDYSFDYFKSLIKHIAKNNVRNLTRNNINEFIFGITKFKNSKDFQEFIENKKEGKINIINIENVWNKILLCDSGSVKRKLNRVFLSKTKKIEQNIEKNVDARISHHLKKNIWLMEKMELKNDQKNIILDFISSIEPMYRKGARKIERSQQDPNKKELHFNHFLRVMRIALGIADASKYKNFARSKEYKDFKSLAEKPDELFKLALKALVHDLIEDSKLNKKELTDLLNNIIGKYPDLNCSGLTSEIAESSDRLNSKNYEDENEERDYKTYLWGNPAKNVRPLYFHEKIVKISDIFHNYQTTVNTYNKHKIEMYDKFVGENIYIVKFIPNRIIAKIFLSNKGFAPKHEKNDQENKYKGWAKVYDLVKYSPEYLEGLRSQK